MFSEAEDKTFVFILTYNVQSKVEAVGHNLVSVQNTHTMSSLLSDMMGFGQRRAESTIK